MGGEGRQGSPPFTHAHAVLLVGLTGDTHPSLCFRWQKSMRVLPSVTLKLSLLLPGSQFLK